MSRNKARLVAMKALFQLDSGLEGLRRVADACSDEEKLTDVDVAYLNNVVQNVVNNQQLVDDTIEKYSIDWDIHRLGKVEKAILRLAVCEMMYVSDVPISVTINEAVLLAKKYGTENASRFINGILGKYSREKFPETAESPKTTGKPDKPEK